MRADEPRRTRNGITSRPAVMGIRLPRMSGFVGDLCSFWERMRGKVQVQPAEPRQSAVTVTRAIQRQRRGTNGSQRSLQVLALLTSLCRSGPVCSWRGFLQRAAPCSSSSDPNWWFAVREKSVVCMHDDDHGECSYAFWIDERVTGMAGGSQRDSRRGAGVGRRARAEVLAVSESADGGDGGRARKRVGGGRLRWPLSLQRSFGWWNEARRDTRNPILDLEILCLWLRRGL